MRRQHVVVAKQNACHFPILTTIRHFVRTIPPAMLQFRHFFFSHCFLLQQQSHNTQVLLQFSIACPVIKSGTPNSIEIDILHFEPCSPMFNTVHKYVHCQWWNYSMGVSVFFITPNIEDKFYNNSIVKCSLIAFPCENEIIFIHSTIFSVYIQLTISKIQNFVCLQEMYSMNLSGCCYLHQTATRKKEFFFSVHLQPIIFLLFFFYCIVFNVCLVLSFFVSCSLHRRLLWV